MFGHTLKFVYPGLLALYSFFNILILGGDKLYTAETPRLYLLSIIFFLCYTTWFSNWFIEKYLLTLLPKIHPLVSQFLISFLPVFFFSLLSVLFTSFYFDQELSYSHQNLLLTLGFSYRVNLFLNCLNAIFYFHNQFKNKAIEAEKFKTLNSQAQLESINSQLNPHFFFNNLSALSELIHHDKEQADRYLQRLASIYRYVLKNNKNELVPLAQELDFLQEYISLLSIRFQDHIRFHLNIDGSFKERLIPPATLQLLLENVVKHNYFTQSEPLEVSIYAKEDWIFFRNPIRRKQEVEESTGIGLRNISDRYQFLGKTIQVSDQDDFFEVRLPLIHQHEDFDRRG